MKVTTTEIRILLFDTYHLVRVGVELVLNRIVDFRLIGSTDNCETAIETAQTANPDIILFDPDMKAGDGLVWLQKLRRNSQKGRIIVLTGLSDHAFHKQCVAMGADGLVMKQHSPEILEMAIRKVSAGELWFDRTLLWEVIGGIAGKTTMRYSGNPEGKIRTLTEMEKKIAELISLGRTHKQIANQIGVSERTVRYNISSLLAKLELKNRTELIAFAAHHRMTFTTILDEQT